MTFNISPKAFAPFCKAMVLSAVAVSWTIPAFADHVSEQITDVVSEDLAPCVGEVSHEHCGKEYAEDSTMTYIEGQEELNAFPTAINSQITD